MRTETAALMRRGFITRLVARTVVSFLGVSGLKLPSFPSTAAFWFNSPLHFTPGLFTYSKRALLNNDDLLLVLVDLDIIIPSAAALQTFI